jgi:hypothetical protein
MDICTLASGQELRIVGIGTQHSPHQCAVLLTKGNHAHAEYFQDRVSANRFVAKLRLKDAAAAEDFGQIQDFFWARFVEQLPGVVVTHLAGATYASLCQYLHAYSLMVGEMAFQDAVSPKAALLAISAAGQPA